MKFTIASDNRGRLRLRLGQYVFNEEQGQGLVTLLTTVPSVTKVATCYKNGSILILYGDATQKSAILRYMSQLTLQEIPKELPTQEVVMAEQEHQFQQDLAVLVGGHYVRKWLFPVWLKPWYYGWRTLGYVKEGLKALFYGKMTVEVLDATAIGVSMLRRDYTTASSTMFLLQLSELLLEYSNTRAKNELTRSLAIGHQTVWCVEEGVEREIPLEELTVGQVIRLRTGVMIPVDGTILSGDGLLNESTMTGEPLPVHKEKDASVFAGTLLEDGEIDVYVRTVGADTRIAQIVDVIHSGEETKATIQGNAERMADAIVPYSFGLFFATYLFTRDLTRALSVLMVDFSCAIKLTTPISVISALKEGAERGIVVKGGKYLELLSQVDTVVFDKTGTLTEAVPSVAKVLTVSDKYTQDEVLTMAACLEEHFPHSVASAIVEEAVNRGLNHPEVHGKVEYIVAHGIVALQNGLRTCIGSYHFIFEDEGISYPEEKKEWLQQEIGSYSAVYFALGEELVGVLCIHDPPRPEAKKVVNQLREVGISDIIMLTGDSEGTARYISEELGLDSFIASVLPDEKANYVEKLKEEGKTVLMVGDGINDAPALSCANVSMTLAGSSDIAREVADISILSHSLEDIVVAHGLSTGLMERIRTHYKGIVGFNASLLLLGVFGITTASQNAWFHNMSTLGFAMGSTKRVLDSSSEKKKNSPLD